MNTQVEVLEGLERRVVLTLPMADLEAEINKRLQRMTKNVRLDGFRPGKVPLKLVAKLHGDEIRGEVVGEALRNQFVATTQAQNLKVAGFPRFEPAQGPEGVTGAAFAAVFEVMPDITVGDVSQITVTRPVVEVTEADVDNTLTILRKQRLHYHAVDRDAREGDRVHVDYVGTIDGQPFQGGEAKDFPLVLGEGRALKEFEAQLLGMRAGGEATFEVTFPEDYFARDLGGKTAKFRVTMGSVHEPHLPDVDGEFARSMGIHDGSVAKLREEIAANLKREAKRRVLSRLKEQVMQGLLEANAFEVPRSLVAAERRTMLEKAVNDLKARGMKEQNIQMSEQVFDAQARRRVALGLLLSEVARNQGIKAEDQQVRAMVEEFAQSYEAPAEVLTWYYQNPDRLGEAKALVMEENVVNWVLERAQVTDESMSLDVLMGKA
jgi:trigger factor